ncbi:Hsp20/alpha crystallin family protein [Methanobacterium alcaliphilum]|uniref:Hsp20/alpha crystallin family protein n=1 Tax=Methanobacterium alcaliphilum TaxID=392018 RepID=UPI00200B2B65|nr:Hsp20/alpha crystallin family protein [Methanobacterium alcaliphilum]
MSEKKKLDRKIEKHKDMLEKRKSAAEKMMDDMVKSIKDMQNDLEKKISEYTEAVPEKPTMDVIETDEKIVVKTDLPGVDKKNINIELSEEKITVTAQFEEEVEVEDANYYKKERKYGEAMRSQRLPEKVLVEEATAKFENGVLTVELPKLEVKKKFNVKIK